MSTDDVRKEVLRDLIEFRNSLPALVARVRALPWDSDEELVVVRAGHLTSIARRYIAGELSAAEVEAWAELIECRDDVGFGSAELMEEMHRLANPSLSGPLTREMANAIIRGFDEAV